MDLLFRRYASPFLLLDEMLKINRLSEFVSELVGIVNEENNDKELWEYWLHKVFDKSYQEFVKAVHTPQQVNNDEHVDFGTTINESMNILNGFVPE